MMLSKFIKEIEVLPSTPKTTSLVAQLKTLLNTKGDIEIDLDHMCKTLGVKILILGLQNTRSYI
jgi:hypothetical protein